MAPEFGAYLERNCPVGAAYESSGGMFTPDLMSAAERAVAADIAVVLLSSRAEAEGWRRELWEPILFTAAEEIGTRVAFVLLEPCRFPALFRRRQFFDASADAARVRRELRRWVLQGAASPNAELPPRSEPCADIAHLCEALLDQPALVRNVDRDAALAFAHEYAACFENVSWLQCAHRGEAGVLGDLAHAAGLNLAGTVRQNRDELRLWFEQRRALLIFNGPGQAIDVSGRASVIVTTRDPRSDAPALESVRELFGAWRGKEIACLRALGTVEYHLHARTQGVISIGTAAASLLCTRGRFAEADEFYGLLAAAARENSHFGEAWRFEREQAWIRERWNDGGVAHTSVPALRAAEQLVLPLA